MLNGVVNPAAEPFNKDDLRDFILYTHDFVREPVVEMKWFDAWMILGFLVSGWDKFYSR